MHEDLAQAIKNYREVIQDLKDQIRIGGVPQSQGTLLHLGYLLEPIVWILADIAASLRDLLPISDSLKDIAKDTQHIGDEH